MENEGKKKLLGCVGFDEDHLKSVQVVIDLRDSTCDNNNKIIFFFLI